MSTASTGASAGTDPIELGVASAGCRKRSCGGERCVPRTTGRALRVPPLLGAAAALATGLASSGRRIGVRMRCSTSRACIAAADLIRIFSAATIAVSSRTSAPPARPCLISSSAHSVAPTSSALIWSI